MTTEQEPQARNASELEAAEAQDAERRSALQAELDAAQQALSRDEDKLAAVEQELETLLAEQG